MTASALQLSLLPDPTVAHARASHPDTSHEAAASVTSITDRQKAVLLVLRLHGPMCDAKLVKIYERMMRDQPQQFPLQSPSGIRSRRAELADPEKTQPPKIVFSGKYEKRDGSRRHRIWILERESWKTA